MPGSGQPLCRLLRTTPKLPEPTDLITDKRTIPCKPLLQRHCLLEALAHPIFRTGPGVHGKKRHSFTPCLYVKILHENESNAETETSSRRNVQIKPRQKFPTEKRSAYRNEAGNLHVRRGAPAPQPSKKRQPNHSEKIPCPNQPNKFHACHPKRAASPSIAPATQFAQSAQNVAANHAPHTRTKTHKDNRQAQQ